MDTQPQRTVCCSECPFKRSTPKEYLDTRGDNGERFIGQAVSASLLPCHMEDGGSATVGKCRQCAGAAKFRANIGVDDLPAALGRLLSDTKTVFATPEELLAHHKGWSLARATRYLVGCPPRVMAWTEMMIAQAKGRTFKTTK